MHFYALRVTLNYVLDHRWPSAASTSSLSPEGELLSRNALCPGPHPGSEIPVCTQLVTICKVGSIPMGAGGDGEEGAVGRGGTGSGASARLPAPNTGGGVGQREEKPEGARGASCRVEAGVRLAMLWGAGE